MHSGDPPWWVNNISPASIVEALNKLNAADPAAAEEFARMDVRINAAAVKKSKFAFNQGDGWRLNTIGFLNSLIEDTEYRITLKWAVGKFTGFCLIHRDTRTKIPEPY